MRPRLVGGLLRTRLWLLLPAAVLAGILFVVPLVLMARTSFSDGLAGFRKVFTSPLLYPILENTLVIATVTTLVTIVLAYVCALAAWRSGPVLRTVVLAFVLLPFWTGVLVKNFAWAALLQDTGLVNDLLQWFGITSGPITILHTRVAVIIGMTHYVLPYAVLPIFAVMLVIERRLELAAASLGADVGGPPDTSSSH